MITSSMEPNFQSFNPQGEVFVYYRNLPHWRQDGATYFVTIRQADSIPAGVAAEWNDERERWLRANGINLAEYEAKSSAFNVAYNRIPAPVRAAFEGQQARRLHEELDRCHGSCLLRHFEPRRIVADSLSYFHGTRLWLGDWVVKPNHLHALLTPMDGWRLEDLLGSIKKWTGRKIGEWLKGQPNCVVRPEVLTTRQAIWQHETYDRIVRDVEELLKYRRYIANNPNAGNAKAGEFSLGRAEWLDAWAKD